MVVVLIAAAGAAWESAALAALSAPRDITVLKRCVDVDDLLATAATGQADVAVVGLDAPGFDLAAVDRLRASGVRPVGVASGGSQDTSGFRAGRAGVTSVLAEDLDGLLDRVRSADHDDDDLAPEGAAGPAEFEQSGEPDHVPGQGPRGRTIAVWGPAGAPGRTTIAAGLAAVLAERAPTVLVDADPYGGAVAQALGVLDEVSGLLSASRLAASNGVGEALGSVSRALHGRLSVVTGLPRADRWVEVRDGTVEALVDAASPRHHVVLDVGFSLERDQFDLGGRRGRNDLTLEALAAADEVIVVATPDPIGLSRLARGLVEFRETVGEKPIRLVVNRMRPSLGWSEREVTTMVEGFARPLGVHFLPEDAACVDAALVSGRTLCEAAPDSSLVQALREVARHCVPGDHDPGVDPSSGRAPTGRGALSRRRAASGRRR